MRAVLTVVDDEQLARSLANAIARFGFAVERARFAPSAFGRAASGKHTALFTEHLEAATRFLVNLRRARPTLPSFVVALDAASGASARDALPGFHVLVAPVTEATLRSQVLPALANRPRATDPTFNSTAELVYDPQLRLVSIAGDTIELSPRHARLMSCLVARASERRLAPWRELQRVCFARGEPNDPLLLEAEIALLREQLGEHRWRMRISRERGVLLVTGGVASGTWSLEGSPDAARANGQ